MFDSLIQMVLGFVAGYPAFASALVVMGGLRLVFKPVFAILQSVVSYTASQKDDALLAKVVGSQIYSIVSFVLDYAASVKLPQPPAK